MAQAAAAQFYQPQGVAVDSAGNVYVADTGNQTIRKITSGGVVTTLAGLAGNYGSNDGTGTNAQFYGPAGVAVDGSGNLYVADYFNQTIRKVTGGGGGEHAGGVGWELRQRRRDERHGALLGSGGSGGRERDEHCDGVCGGFGQRHDSGAGWPGTNWVSGTLAGSASTGSADATGSAARFYWPGAAAVDSAGNVYVADTQNGTIRKVTAAGVVSTLAGSAGKFGSTDGQGANARFYGPQGIAVDSAGTVYVADTVNATIRKVTAAGRSDHAGRVGGNQWHR